MIASVIARMALVLLCAISAGAAAAHEIRPAIATATFSDGHYDIAIVANMEALLAGIGPAHADSNESALAADYDRLRALPANELKAQIEAFAPRWLQGIHVTFDGVRARPRIAAIDVPAPGDLGLARLTTVRLAGDIPSGTREFQWQYAAEYGSSVLRVQRAGDDEIVATWLKDGAASAPIPVAGAAAKSTAEVLLEYLVLGFTHILPKGLDHILFVLGLYLLSPQLKPLLWQVSAFTVAHSITLALGLYGVVEVSPAIVEPLIAASIVYVAVENVISPKLSPWRTLIVFGFGLLHGLGFAGVLEEIGLPRAHFVTALIGFNIGVELGQLAVIALAFAATGLWFRTRPWYRSSIVVPASLAIAMVGAFWTVERVVA
jgi:hypothetical protein